MRDWNIISGVYHHHEAISPEVARAQTIAYFKDLAEYRARKIKKYKEWVDPNKRAEIKAAATSDLAAAREIVNEKLVTDPNYFDKVTVRGGATSPGDLVLGRCIDWLPTQINSFKTKPLIKPIQHRTRWLRFKEWILGIF